jgi:hypothetical protein
VFTLIFVINTTAESNSFEQEQAHNDHQEAKVHVKQRPDWKKKHSPAYIDQLPKLQNKHAKNGTFQQVYRQEELK